MRCLSMPWERKFPDPIRLRDGRVFTTLRDAGDFILSEAQATGEMGRDMIAVTQALVLASQTDKRGDVARAWALMVLCLGPRGLMPAEPEYLPWARSPSSAPTDESEPRPHVKPRRPQARPAIAERLSPIPSVGLVENHTDRLSSATAAAAPQIGQ